jgi:hypothetical protein
MRTKEQIYKQQSKWYFKNKTRILKSRKLYYDITRDSQLSYRKIWYKSRMSNLLFRLSEGIRSRVKNALPNHKQIFTTIELLGCSLEQYKQHLESKFQPGMCWENYGKWQIDHIVACKNFNLNLPLNQLSCFHFLNTQPLWASENATKDSRHK